MTRSPGRPRKIVVNSFVYERYDRLRQIFRRMDDASWERLIQAPSADVIDRLGYSDLIGMTPLIRQALDESAFPKKHRARQAENLARWIATEGRLSLQHARRAFRGRN